MAVRNFDRASLFGSNTRRSRVDRAHARLWTDRDGLASSRRRAYCGLRRAVRRRAKNLERGSPPRKRKRPPTAKQTLERALHATSAAGDASAGEVTRSRRPSPPVGKPLGRKRRGPASARSNPSRAAQPRRKVLRAALKMRGGEAARNPRRGARGGGQGDPDRTLQEAATAREDRRSVTRSDEGRRGNTAKRARGRRNTDGAKRRAGAANS